jgi:hypothetical protein
MVRPSTRRLVAAAAILGIIAPAVNAQMQRSGGAGHQDRRSQYVGAGKIGPAPGSLARPNVTGIGVSSRANIDLLSTPRRFEVPPPVFSPAPPIRWKWPRHHGHHHHHDRWCDERTYIPAYPISPVGYYEPVITVGTGLSVGGYGYSSGYTYPSQAVGGMPLPAPALVFAPATATPPARR